MLGSQVISYFQMSAFNSKTFYIMFCQNYLTSLKEWYKAYLNIYFFLWPSIGMKDLEILTNVPVAYEKSR